MYTDNSCYPCPVSTRKTSEREYSQAQEFGEIACGRRAAEESKRKRRQGDNNCPTASSVTTQQKASNFTETEVNEPHHGFSKREMFEYCGGMKQKTRG
jgi:hypothetical protein